MSPEWTQHSRCGRIAGEDHLLAAFFPSTPAHPDGKHTPAASRSPCHAPSSPRPPEPPGRAGGGGGAAAGAVAAAAEAPPPRPPGTAGPAAKSGGGGAVLWRAGGGERRRGRAGRAPSPPGSRGSPCCASRPSPGRLRRCRRPTERCGPASGSRGDAPVPGGAGGPGSAAPALLLSRAVLSLQLEMPARTRAPPSCSGLDLRAALPPASPPRGLRPPASPAPRPLPRKCPPERGVTRTAARPAPLRSAPPELLLQERLFTCVTIWLTWLCDVLLADWRARVEPILICITRKSVNS